MRLGDLIAWAFDVLWPRRRELPYPLPNVRVESLSPATLYRLFRRKS